MCMEEGKRGKNVFKVFLSFEKGKNMAVELMYRTLIQREESMYLFEKQRKGYKTIQ